MSDTDYGKIPLIDGKPDITDRMKAECIGEFKLEVEQTCTACFYDEAQSECEVCGGEIEFTTTHDIPWTMMKDIFKMMATVAMKPEPEPSAFDLVVEFNDDKTEAKIFIKDMEYTVQVGNYQGVGEPRIWIDDYSSTGLADVWLDDLVNPLNRETERGAVVEKAIEIHKELTPVVFSFSYF